MNYEKPDLKGSGKVILFVMEQEKKIETLNLDRIQEVFKLNEFVKKSNLGKPVSALQFRFTNQLATQAF